MTSNRNINKNSLKFVVYEDELSDYQNDSDGLEIDECPSPRKKKSIPQLDSNEKAVLENIDKEIDKQLEEKAANTNMSAQNVKNILKHIITNEQVLALVRNTANNEPFRTENLTFEPKLTRAKVKELFKNQATSLHYKKSEVHVLIDEELPEDEEDDEYIPGDEESDDDRSTLNPSDLDSQPPTPATPSTCSAECATQTSWTDDGLFKVPNKILKSPSSSTSQIHAKSQENIALRTRSKLSLSDTPLECIEQAFIPPDITTDMYDIDCDDEDWTNFLKEFTLPLQAVTTATNEDDDEADPEYNILADEEIDAVDKEELRVDRGVKVTKRELNDLVAELFDFVDLFTPCPNNTNEDSKSELSHTESTPRNGKPPETCQSTNNAESEIYSRLILEQSPGNSPCNVINNEQILLLEQQIRQHVQLITQQFMQICGHPIYNEFSGKLKEMMVEITQITKKNPKSSLNSINLKNAMILMKDWEQKILNGNTEIQEMMQFINNELRRYTSYKKIRKIFHPKLPPLLLKTMSKSDVFIYPFLLPRIPYLPIVSIYNKVYYTPAEDALTAIGLEQFMSYLYAEKILKNGKPSITDACQLIVRFLMPPKDYLSLCHHIISLKNGPKSDNPINYYFKHKMAPQTTHYVVVINQCVPVYKQNKELLHEPWKSYIYPETKISTLDQIKPFESDNSTQLRVPIPSLKNYNKSIKTCIPKRRKPKGTSSKYIKFNTVFLKDKTALNNKNDVQKSIIFQVKSSNDKFVSNTFIMLPSMPGLSPFKHISTNSVENVENCENTTIETPSTSDISSDPIKNIDAIKNVEKKVVKNTSENFNQDEKRNKEVEISSPVKSNSTIKSKPKITASEKKKAKQQKEFETVRTLLSPENPNVVDEKANHYAHAYFHKVKERLNSPEDYNLFLATLSDHDESSDSVTDLYSKVTAILSPKHPDLCEEFITFLTPAQAKEIEKLIPYCMFSKMATFLRKLETYYNKQPAQIRKIYNSLVELSSQESVTMDLIKSTVLPLLKGNSYLIDYFLQIFSEEKPPQSLMTVWEEIDCDTLSNKNAKNVECFETLKVPDIEDPYGNATCICSCHNSSNEEYSSRNRHCISCGTKFIQGKVFIQTGKGPRPVSVTFPDGSMEEQSKRLSITLKSRPKRRSEAVSHKTTPFSPSKHTHNEFEEDEHFGTKCNRNSPKKISKSPKSNSSRKFTLAKSRKVDSRKGEKEEMKKGEIDSQKKFVKSNLGFTNSKKDAPIKNNINSKSDTVKFESEIDPIAVSSTNESDFLKKTEKTDQQDSIPMEWDDCNASVESIELKLSPNRSVESSDLCEESSQDLSEGNEDIPATCSESENDSIIEAESIHSESSSSDNQEVSKQISSGWTRDEDKIILKTFQQECDSENKFDIIGELLPHRTVHEIRERFETLMNLLLKITKSN